MIACPHCRHENLQGAVFCIECGGQLPGPVSATTNRINPEDVQARSPASPSLRSAPLASDSVAWGSLHLLDSGHILPLAARAEFVLGRSSEGQAIVPDIDLAPFDAHAQGVSRLHASLKRDGRQVLIIDLASANGTYLNGRRLPANLEQPLQHGDVISLGKLRAQFLASLSEKGSS